MFVVVPQKPQHSGKFKICTYPSTQWDLGFIVGVYAPLNKPSCLLCSRDLRTCDTRDENKRIQGPVLGPSVQNFQ